MQEFLYGSLVIGHPVTNDALNAVVGLAVHPFRENVRQRGYLFDHGWNDQIDYGSDDGKDNNQRDDDGECPHLYVQLVLHEFHDRVEQVS